jgi:phosphatidylethanolamine-binding protein (PEBP) family uncharacterized protein
MAIQFPPINTGDAAPNDGDSYFYQITQEEFIYDADTNSWSINGIINDSSFGFRGTLRIQEQAPADALRGNVYSVEDGGIADESFGTLGGTNVEQWTLIIYTGTDWVPASAPGVNTGPWTRTSGGQIQPINQSDNLNMVNGSYIIESLPDLENDSGGGDGGDGGDNGGGNNGGNVSITLSTTSWAGTNALANQFFFNGTGCPGNNDSPALAWAVTGDIPDGATFRLRCIDVDANDFIHWSVDGIPSATRSIAENGVLPNGATANDTDFEGEQARANGWAGPCPPADSGNHNYTFTIRLVNSTGTVLATSNNLVSTIST